jgi:hypothetical protein
MDDFTRKCMEISAIPWRMSAFKQLLKTDGLKACKCRCGMHHAMASELGRDFWLDSTMMVHQAEAPIIARTFLGETYVDDCPCGWERDIIHKIKIDKDAILAAIGD